MLSPEQARNRARDLRKNAPDAENKLWYLLRNRQLEGFKFVRQLAIDPFIADFACREAALIVELDGGQHATSKTDASRTAYLNGEGYSVLRFWNSEVFENRDGVVEAILSVLHGSPSPGLRFAPADLSPMGRGKKGIRAASGARAASTKESGLATDSSPRRGEGRVRGASAPSNEGAS